MMSALRQSCSKISAVGSPSRRIEKTSFRAMIMTLALCIAAGPNSCCAFSGLEIKPVMHQPLSLCMRICRRESLTTSGYSRLNRWSSLILSWDHACQQIAKCCPQPLSRFEECPRQLACTKPSPSSPLRQQPFETFTSKFQAFGPRPRKSRKAFSGDAPPPGSRNASLVRI